MNKDYDYLETYHKHGGFYEIPDKVISDLVGEIEDLTQALNEIREYYVNEIIENKTLIEQLEGTNSFRIGNAQAKIKDYENIVQIIDKHLGDEK